MHEYRLRKGDVGGKDWFDAPPACIYRCILLSNGILLPAQNSRNFARARDPGLLEGNITHHVLGGSDHELRPTAFNPVIPHQPTGGGGDLVVSAAPLLAENEGGFSFSFSRKPIQE